MAAAPMMTPVSRSASTLHSGVRARRAARRLGASRAASVVLLAALLVHAGAPSAQRRDAADAVALSGCLIDADLRVAAIQQMQRGERREAVVAAARKVLEAAPLDERMRAERIVDEVYRERPSTPRPYVAARLRECTAAVGSRMRAERADDCYQVTHFARDFFAARDAGIGLEQTQQSIRSLAAQQALPAEFGDRLGRLAATVYASKDEAPKFRAGLFYHCVVEPRAPR
ncbi:MAG: hypothetical protein OHK0044_21170 [Burkholderiaceae bacterium]